MSSLLGPSFIALLPLAVSCFAQAEGINVDSCVLCARTSRAKSALERWLRQAIGRSLLLLFPRAAKSYFLTFSAGSSAAEGHLGEVTLFQVDQPPCRVPQSTAWHACDFPHRFHPQ